MYKNPDINSSYRKNDIGRVLYNTVLELKPNKIVEFGCLHGYSTVAMSLALKQLGGGKIHCYDLWENYQYNHSTLDTTRNNIKKYGVEDYVIFETKDYNEWLLSPEPFDLMHLDISNTGDIIAKTYDALPAGSIVIFEGGSVDRDEVDWMIKYDATPINSVKAKVNYDILTEEFPSLSIFKK